MTPPPPALTTLQLDVDEHGVALCTFNRPEVRNALNQTMVDELRATLRYLTERDDIVALIFTGAGERAFISGADIAELRERRRVHALRRINNSLLREVEQFAAPTIAAIRGYALGGGCEMAQACDLRVCGHSAKFGQPEVGLGILPGAGATYRLPRLVGPGFARELIYTGRIIDADEALRIGLVNRVVPDSEVVETARGLAAQIAANSRLAVRFAKMALGAAGEMSTDVGMALEATSQAVLFDDDEKVRRMDEFLTRRKAKQDNKRNEKEKPQ